MKAQLLVSAPAASLDELAEGLRAVAQRAASKVDTGRGRVAVRFPGDPAADAPQDGQVAAGTADRDRPSFEGFVEIDWGGRSVPLDAFAGATTMLTPLVDPSRSAVLVGMEHVVIPGSGPLLLMMALRRLARFTPESFHAHWRNEHAPHVLETVPDLGGYRQVHADAVASRQAAERAGVAIGDLDGVAEGYFESLDHFAGIMARPEVAADAGFIDHAASVAYLYQVIA